MRTTSLAASLGFALTLFGGLAHSQSGDIDPNLMRQLDAIPNTSPQGIWEKQYDQAKTRSDRLELLRRAWDNSMDSSLSEADRAAWHDAWLLEYKKATIEAAMPNPYAP